jgi:hypothetical protein
LPGTADRQILAEGIREAARVYARDARTPSANELHDEIAGLHRAAEKRQFDQVAKLLEGLSTMVGDWLADRAGHINCISAGKRRRPRVSAIGRNGKVIRRKVTAPQSIALPSPDDLRDETRREHACETIAMLCRTGGRCADGRRRPTGRRSKSWQWELYAPRKTKHPTKRKAEREFVGALREAWLKSLGKPPSRTADHHQLGPFARFVKECVRLVGAYHSDDAVAELINEVERRRRTLRSRMTKQILDARREIVRQRHSALSRINSG